MDYSKELGIGKHDFRLVFGGTKVEYDPEKEEINRRKHGYALESAVHYFERLLLPFSTLPKVITSDSFVENGEVRQMHMTLDDMGNIVIFVTTMRENETVRIISFRRARKAECEIYERMVGRAL
ncbi:BrnT family toxin [Vibrio parahaemolyticus]|nr:BrnT family toxin [Vibrio parahaemolyticus]ELA9330937.1 BrnT family toxin [Vibrio parahaemolyticus]